MKILIIEDEIRLAEALLQTMEREGHSGEICTDGMSGYAYGETGLYDVILLDLMLPKMDGITVLKNLRKNRVETPVILLTAKGELEDKLDGFDSGADDYLTKPFATQELLARIYAVTKRSQIKPAKYLTVGNAELHIKKCQLVSTESGKEIAMSAKELKLLEYLMRNPNQVISRGQITERVWGYDSEAEYNNVDVYISFLRKKIAFVEAKIHIKTVRGLGYLLEESHD